MEDLSVAFLLLENPDDRFDLRKNLAGVHIAGVHQHLCLSLRILFEQRLIVRLFKLSRVLCHADLIRPVVNAFFLDDEPRFRKAI